MVVNHAYYKRTACHARTHFSHLKRSLITIHSAAPCKVIMKCHIRKMFIHPFPDRCDSTVGGWIKGRMLLCVCVCVCVCACVCMCDITIVYHMHHLCDYHSHLGGPSKPRFRRRLLRYISLSLLVLWRVGRHCCGRPTALHTEIC